MYVCMYAFIMWIKPEFAGERLRYNHKEHQKIKSSRLNNNNTAIFMC